MDAVDIKTIPQGYKQSDLGLIPNDWDVKELGNIVIFKNGKAHENFINNDGSYIVVNSKFISSEGEVVKHSDKQLCPAEKDSILMVMSDVPSGKAIAKCFFVEKSGKYTINQRICSFYPKISPLFLYYKINRNPYFLAFDDGVKQTNLRKSEVLACEIAIPNSISEQDNISKVLSDIDSLIQKTEKLISKKKAIKQGVMSQLLSGKQRLPGFNGEWKEINLTEGYWFQEGPGVRTSQFTKSGIKLLNGTNIFKGEVNLETTERFISKSEAYGPYSHFLADDGDIVIASSGISVEKFEEKVAFIRKKHLPLCMNTSTIRFKSLDYTNKKISFLYYFLMTEMFKKQISSQATGSAQLNFGPAHLKKITMNLPVDPREQEAIIDIIADLDKEISRQEKRLVKYNQIKQGAMQVLLTGKIRLNTNPYDNPITQSRAN